MAGPKLLTQGNFSRYSCQVPWQPRRFNSNARYSSDRQSETSLIDQVRLCRARAEREIWTVVGVYEDAAASGALRNRRGYLRLVADALAGKIDLVLG
jgi:Resolvase, N terminal domain